MKYLIIVFSLLTVLACKQPANDSKQLQQRIDSLEKKLEAAYRPGLGEFMSGIQVHHAKLWFAGLHENWPLADFEVHEIMESLDDINSYCSDRSEIKQLPMINGPLDSVNKAINVKDLSRFKTAFTLLTNTCNNCHKTTDHGFNVIKIPDSPPLSNQDFGH